VGGVELLALATPGHRPEHTSYLVQHGDGPPVLLSGDSLLVGNLARPDLAVRAEDGARELWASVRRLLSLGDEVEVWPAHVGASLCASGNASEATSSTIGDERRANPLLSAPEVEEFVSELTRCIPARPPTVERVVEINQEGASDPGPVRELDANCLAQFFDGEICVLDVREPGSFDAAHLAGSINLSTAGHGLGTRAGWAAGPAEPIVLVAPSFAAGREAAELLRAAGVWNLSGLTIAEPIAWAVAGLPIETSEALSPDRLVPRFRDGELTLIDVRDPSEWSSGHIPGSRNLPLSELGDGREAAAALDAPIAVVCASGARAALAASILRRRGRFPVARVSGGVQQIAREGISLVREQ
jgi:rhodanese-related sulfurtransferase